MNILAMDDGKVNAMSPAWVAAFPEAWKRATEGERPVVIASAAKAFGAGLDLRKLAAMGAGEVASFAEAFHRVFRAVLAYPRPVVAAIDGAAIAGGAVLALCCDARVVTPRAKMGVTEVVVGVPFPEPVLEIARMRLAPPELRSAALEGAIREGADLVARGWAERLVAPEDLQNAAVGLATDLGALAAPAFAHAKAWLARDATRAFGAFDAAAWGRAVHHPDARAALARTLERLATRAGG